MARIQPHEDPSAGNSGHAGPLGSEIEAGTRRHAADRRPQYSVASLIIEVQRVLREAGVQVSTDPNMLYTASIAGCDLLRALGVVPISAELRRDR